MTSSDEDARDLRLAEIVSNVGDAVTRGEWVDLNELCLANPDLSDELRRLWGTILVTDTAGAADDEAPADSSSVGITSRWRSLRLPTTIDDYELLQELGRGGMGVVYRARQISLGREVAIKMILRGRLASEGDLRRFLAEASATAKLEHPNIVPVYEVGDIDGRPFFSMQLIEGQTLADRARGNPLSQRRAARIVATVARAIAFAHRQGVLHRDLKPSNILLTKSGTPMVSDFGLAKQDWRPVTDPTAPPTPSKSRPSRPSSPSRPGRGSNVVVLKDEPDDQRFDDQRFDDRKLDDRRFDDSRFRDARSSGARSSGASADGTDADGEVDSANNPVGSPAADLRSPNAGEATRSGMLIGTPAYMPPEQAGARRQLICPGSDVYSLGCILYFALTGRGPFVGDSPVDLVMQVIEQEPTAPRALRPGLNRDLEGIVIRCLQKPIDLRYPTADALADDLEAYLNDERVTARSGQVGQVVARLFRETHHASILEMWGTLWIWHSLVLLTISVLTWALGYTGVDSRLVYGTLWTVGLGAWAAVFWKMRQLMGPVTFIERQIAHVWGASMIGIALLFPLEYWLSLPVLTLSPLLAIISAMVFIIKAGMLNGAFYLQAFALLSAAVAMAITPQFAHLYFGVVAALSFFIPGYQYRQKRRYARGV